MSAASKAYLLYALAEALGAHTLYQQQVKHVSGR
jgi:hypothetical protein